MKITVLDSKKDITFDEINTLTESVGWGQLYYRTEEKWQRVLHMSRHIAYVRENGKLIGFGRIVEDGTMCMCYDLCVHPDYQKTGVASSIAEYFRPLVKDEDYVSIGLFVWEGNKTALDFYKKFGFEKVPAMELKKYMRTL